MCGIIDKYCRSLYGPRCCGEDEYLLRQKMAKEHYAEYFFDKEVGCDVLVFEDEADFMVFKLKSNNYFQL